STVSLSLSLIPSPPTSPLFPYTTLFRSYCFRLTIRCLNKQFQAPRFAGNSIQGGYEIDLVRLTAMLEFDRRVDRCLIFGLCVGLDRKSTRLNSSHVKISYAVFCLKEKIR